MGEFRTGFVATIVHPRWPFLGRFRAVRDCLERSKRRIELARTPPWREVGVRALVGLVGLLLKASWS